MRIAIAGASGTGKTTLARAISKKYNIPLNPVGARSVALEMGFDNPYDVDKAGCRVKFQNRLFEAKRDWELAHDDFVTDRSYLDNLTYCALHMVDRLDDNALEVFSGSMRRYNFVVRLWKKDFQALDDGIRKTSGAYHDCYEAMLTGLLAIARVPVIDLSGDRLTRLEKVSQALDMFQKITAP
ncbi:MAG TPA: AAA family ATPase [Gemmatimonadaceae bacterium]|nr:AAA family ATPase [Gemmatimonadaceae bacterium]